MKENIGLVRSTTFAVVLCCLLVTSVFLVCRPKPATLLKEKKNKKPRQMCSPVNSVKPSRISPFTEHLWGLLP